MAKEFAKAFYKGKDWQQCRKAYILIRIATDGGMCEVCHNNLGYIVHHKEPLTPDNISDTSITLSFDNLRYECKDCHDREDGHLIGPSKKFKRY